MSDIFRLLLDPDPAPGGGPDPAPTPPAEERVTLTAAEYQQLRSAADSAQQRARTVEERIAAVESRYRAEATANAVGGALERLADGVGFISADAAAAARRLLAAEIQVRDDGTAIHARTGKPVNQLTYEDVPEIGYFMKPKGGGTGRLGGGTPTSQHPGPPDYNRQIIERWKAAQAAAADAGMPALGYGFRPGK